MKSSQPPNSNKLSSNDSKEEWEEEFLDKTSGPLSPFDHLYEPDDDGAPAKFPCGYYHLNRNRIKSFISKAVLEAKREERKLIRGKIKDILIQPHLPPGMTPNLDEVIWNKAINKALLSIEDSEGKETE